MKKHLKLLLLSSFLFATALINVLSAQCDSNSGTMLQGGVTYCGNDQQSSISDTIYWYTINNVYGNNAVLDTNDILRFYFTDTDGPLNGQIFSSTVEGENMPLPVSDLALDTPYRIFAVVGNNNGNDSIDFSDPCLSISGGWGVYFGSVPQEVAEINIFAELNCDGTILLSAIQSVWGDLDNYEFQWSTGDIDPEITVSEPGFYFVDIIEDGATCPIINSFDISPYNPPAFNFDPVDSISCIEDTLLLKITPAGFLGAWTGNWLDQNNNIIATDILETSVNSPGTYYFEITFLDGDDENCTETYEVIVPASTDGCVSITGTIVRDQNNDCAYDLGEPGLANRLLRFSGTNTTRYALTDSDGNYLVYFPANTDAEISIVSQHFLYQNCQTSWTEEGVAVAQTIVSHAAQSTIDDCPLLNVQLHAGITRRCFSVPFDVSYCNTGNLSAEDAYIVVTLDEHFSIDTADLSFIDLGNNQYQFDLGDVVEDDCGSFTFHTTLSCDAMLGETLCSEAHIFPDAPCPGPDAAWSEASLSITGSCDGTENTFFIENIGAVDMIDASNYIVIEDGVMLFQSPEDITLTSGEILELSYPANGSTYRVEAVQVPNHPGMSMPSYTIEGCGGFGSTGFVNQFAQDDLDPFIDIECRVAIGSYDPNDKTAFPSGYSEEHFIKDDQQLEYLIRFQNTGTDTAFTVMVQDVIDPNLDFNSFRPKGASHNYEVLFLENDTIQFLFNNILLPDSTTNSIGSNGYIRFTISPKADIPLGTVIHNEAAIFFDFNEAIITNDVFHTIGENFIVVTDIPFVSDDTPKVTSYPNPVSKNWFLKVDNLNTDEEFNLRLTDTRGQVISEKTFNSAGQDIDVSDLATGIYFWTLEGEHGMVSSGKLIRM